VRTLRELAVLVVAAAIGLLVGGLGVGLLLTLCGVLAGLGHSALRWAAFTYTMHDDRIELRHSFVRRSVKIIPFDRIRGVDISTTMPHRLLGVAVVHIDAAAGKEGQDDGKLDAVSRTEAERVRHALLGSTATSSADLPATGVVHARASLRWFLYAPLSGAYLLTPFAVVGSAAGTLYNVGDDLGLITRRRVEHLGHDLAGMPSTVALSVMIALVLAMPLASVVAFALFNWDFTLRSTDGEAPGGAVIAERGLLTRRSVALERRRIRGVALLDNPVERLAGVVRLDALVTGLGRAEHRGRLLPAVPRGLAQTVAAQLLATSRQASSPETVPPLVSHPRAARSRRVVRAVVPFLAAAGMAAFLGRTDLAYLLVVLALLGIPLGLDRYRQLGHYSGNGCLSVRSGSLRRHQIVVEHRAIVGWRLSQTLFQRRLGLATLDAAVGAGHGGCPAIDMAESDAVTLARDVTPDWIVPFLEVPESVTRAGGRRT
jgi:putative membrane protein